MKDKNKLKIGALVALSACVMLPVTGEEVSAELRDTITRTSVEKQDILARSVTLKTKADRLMIEANKQLVEGEFKGAIKYYLEAKKIFSSQSGDVFASELASCNKSIEQSYFLWSQKLIAQANEKATEKDYAAAIAFCQEAIKLFPENAKAYREKIETLERERVAAEMRESTGETALLPDKGAQEYRISVLMAQAQKLVEERMYDKAARKYSDILLIDPYNAAAINNLRSVRVRGKEVAIDRFDIQHRKMMTEIEWRWVNPILPEGEKAINNVITSAIDKDAENLNNLEDKIRNIVIPEVSFTDISVAAAVKMIQELSKANDPEGKGVNIYYRRPMETDETTSEDGTVSSNKTVNRAEPEVVADPGAEGDGFNDDFADDAADFVDDAVDAVVDAVASVDEGPQISISFTNRSIYGALLLICDAADLQMRVERSAVVLASKNIALDEMETRIFPVAQSTFDALDTSDNEALMTFFTDLKIPFPEGSSVVYDNQISRLIVTNTFQNLQLLDSILQDITSGEDTMVEISAKFIEISQNDLQELGFDYTVSYNPNGSNYSDGKTNKLTFDDSLTGMNRSASESPIFTLTGQTDDSNGLNYKVDIFAQNTASSTDVLASPRITTLENTTAYIGMYTSQSFADDYEAGESETYSPDDGGYLQRVTIGPQINFDNASEIGIQMTVTPEVDHDRRTITLTMNPTLKSFVGYQEYTYINEDGELEQMKKPIFKNREVNTKVTIFDGETIVLGGIIEDSTATINDKIPILGDLPLVGRLFQSRSTSASKTNLLIFMTCRLVKPDGTPKHPGSVTKKGLPEVSRLD